MRLVVDCRYGAFSGMQKSNSKYGNEHEAIAVYHMMRGVEKFCPIYTLCIGNAFGEAALLLSAGSKVRSHVGVTSMILGKRTI